MARRAIRECDAKRLLARYLVEAQNLAPLPLTYHGKVALVQFPTHESDSDNIPPSPLVGESEDASSSPPMRGTEEGVSSSPPMRGTESVSSSLPMRGTEEGVSSSPPMGGTEGGRIHYPWEQLLADNPWLADARLVVKPDQLFSKRGKHGLLGVDLSFEEVQAWIVEHAYKEVTVGQTTDKLTTFLIEPFIPHAQEDEMFIAIRTQREGDVIYFSWEGGIDIEENWDSVVQIFVPIELTADLFAGADAIGTKADLLKDLDIGGQILAARERPSSPPTGETEEGLSSSPPMGGTEGGAFAEGLPTEAHMETLTHFIKTLYKFFVDLGFAYIEVNPFILGFACRDAKPCASTMDVLPLDFVAHLDDTALIMDAWRKWDLGPVDFPPPFGRHLTSEEAYIRNLDEKSGCSLKLTVLNPKGRVWPMVAGGGASVIYADTVTDLGFADELACYGEYSGNPTTDETREYARTILDLMTREPDPEGRPKFLLIGGGIANFTDVAKTFTGIMDALREYRDKLRENNVRIYVRRGGPNHEVGLAMMRQLGEELAVPLEVYGPETHMTRIVRMALG